MRDTPEGHSKAADSTKQLQARLIVIQACLKALPGADDNASWGQPVAVRGGFQEEQAELTAEAERLQFKLEGDRPMPKAPRGEKRSTAMVGLAVHVARRIATGEIQDTVEDGKDLAAKALGKKGRAARAASMTPERRAEIAREAAAKRWSKHRP